MLLFGLYYKNYKYSINVRIARFFRRGNSKYATWDYQKVMTNLK